MSNSYKPITPSENSNNQNKNSQNDQYVAPDTENTSMLGGPPLYHNDTTSQAMALAEPVRPKVMKSSKSHMFQVGFYRAYFDLDTETFIQKIKIALNPLNKASIGEDHGDLELFGFIWITGTLIFLMFVSSTAGNLLSEWLHSDSDEDKYEYSFALLTLSITLFYCYNLLVPFLLYAYTSFVLKFPHQLSLVRLISIYGYTNILWFPMAFINLIVVVFISNKKHKLLTNLIQWTCVGVFGFVTGLSNLVKLTPMIKKNCLELAETNSNFDQKKAYNTILGFLIVAHLGFLVLVKINFF